MTTYEDLFENPGDVTLLRLAEVTQNSEKCRRIEAFVGFARTLLQTEVSLLLCGSSIWGRDDGSGKPSVTSDIDVLAITQNLDFVDAITDPHVPPDNIIQSWHDEAIDMITIFGELSNIRASFSAFRPAFFERLCQGEGQLHRSFRYNDAHYKQPDLFYGIGFEHWYELPFKKESMEGGYVIYDSSNQIKAPDGRFMIGHMHNRTLTGVPYPDHFEVNQKRQHLYALIAQMYGQEKQNHQGDIGHLFSWIQKDWERSYGEALLGRITLHLKNNSRLGS